MSSDLEDFSSEGFKRRDSVRSIILLMLIPFVVGSAGCFWLYWLYHDFFVLEFYFGILIFCVCLILPYIFYEKLDELMGSNSKIRLGSTYQWSSLMSAMFYLVVFVWILIISKLVVNSYAYVCSFGCIIPLILGLFGFKIFNDTSCYLDEGIVLGYHYICLWISFFIGLIGFYNVSELINVNLNTGVLVFIFTILFQLIFAFPNIANKCVPFELKIKKNFIYFTVILFSIYLLIMIYFNLGSQININLTYSQMLKNAFVYGLGLLFAILFYKQAKKFNKD